jgi:hypothetical protein
MLAGNIGQKSVSRGARKASSTAARGLYLRIILHTPTCSAIVRPAFLPQEFRGSEIRLRCYRHMEVEAEFGGDALRLLRSTRYHRLEWVRGEQ